MKLITKRQAADRIGCHVKSIEYWVKRKVFPVRVYKAGNGFTMIDEADMPRLIEWHKHRTGNVTP